MKPIENKQAFENELIDHIKETLTEHEDAYRLGAWEDFNKPDKKKRAFFWIEFAGAAAAILLIASISFLLMNNAARVNNNQLVNSKKTSSHNNNLQKQANQEKNILGLQKNNSKTHLVIEDKNSGSQNNIAKTINNTKERQTIDLFKEPNLTSTELLNNNQTHVAYLEPKKNEFINVRFNSNQITLINAPSLINNSIQKPLNSATDKIDIIEFLEKESKKNQITKNKDVTNKKADRFTLGIMVAPSFGNVKKLNMGYGLGVDYSFSENISISSGITYNQMGGGKILENTNAGISAKNASLASKENPTKTLKYFEENIAGIDIPLDIKYHFNKNIYANVGVSALAVISQSRNSIFLEEKVVEIIESTFVGDMVTSSFVNERVTEQTKLDNYSFLGFYNFSFGYKNKILKKNTIAIEPFIKLPMKEFNAENLKLMGTGVKLKLDF